LATLLAEYNVDEPHARQDLLALLTDLSARGLLELHGLTPT
jgi:Mg2+/Co2+ transporter CorC